MVTLRLRHPTLPLAPAALYRNSRLHKNRHSAGRFAQNLCCTLTARNVPSIRNPNACKGIIYNRRQGDREWKYHQSQPILNPLEAWPAEYRTDTCNYSIHLGTTCTEAANDNKTRNP